MDDQWSRLLAELAECQQKLETSVKMLDDHESMQDTLAKWLKEKEALVKDSELRPSLAEKKLLLNKLKVMS